MNRLSLSEFVYYGVLISALAVYLTIFIKNRRNIIDKRRNISRWGIVASYAVIGIIAAAIKMIAWLPALLSAGIACLIAYFVIFVKYKD